MGVLLQVVFDIFAALGFLVIMMRMSRAPKDDPRLSRGLQLLQSKIAVLEDLSDRTETQVHQMAALLEQKAKEVQAKIQLADRHVHEIRVSMQNSLEVAKIFQDKIPHQEIIERKNSLKYVQAARLAHQGFSIDQIAAQVDLPKGEIEFISKVNREQLMFNEEHLPAWAKDEASTAPAAEAARAEFTQMQNNSSGFPTFSIPIVPTAVSANSEPAHVEGALAHLAFTEDQSEENTGVEDEAARFRAEIEIAERQKLVENLSRLQFEMQTLDQQLARDSGGRDLSSAFAAPKTESEALQKIGEEFRRACQEAPPMSEVPARVQVQAVSAIAAAGTVPSEPKERSAPGPLAELSAARAAARELNRQALVSPVINGRHSLAAAPAPVIRKVQFPRIEGRDS